MRSQALKLGVGAALAGILLALGFTYRAQGAWRPAQPAVSPKDPSDLISLVSGRWSTLAAAGVVRNYHSATVLLPNGAVLTAGGGVPGGENAPAANFNAEVFYPPYLFRSEGGRAQLADRPRLRSISARRFAYGREFQIEQSDDRPISAVTLLGLGTTTHSFDMGQRFVPASYSQRGALLTVTAPANSAIAPPGYYQVVSVDSAGVPSRGFIVELGPDLPEPDLAAHFPFDQASGTTVDDVSGRDEDGTVQGGASWVVGRVGSHALGLSGSEQYVSLPSALVQDCRDFTFAAWINLSSNADWSRIQLARSLAIRSRSLLERGARRRAHLLPRVQRRGDRCLGCYVAH